MVFRLPALRAISTPIASRRLFSNSARLTAAPSTAPPTAPPTATPTPSATENVVVAPNPDPLPGSSTGQNVARQQSFMVPTYSRPLPIFVTGKGLEMTDIDGRRYLDFTAGISVTSLGHCDPLVSAIISDQASTLVHTSNLYYNTWTGRLSESLVAHTKASGGMHDAAAAFICNSGSEANEAAIKFARKFAKSTTGSLDSSKFEVVSFTNAFHGRTMGALSATPNPKYQRPFGPMVPGFKQGVYNDISSLDVITENTCAVIVEPIQGEGGVYAASQQFLSAIRQRCDAVGAVLIYDEIQCGMSRTGRLWAHSNLPTNAHPDIITTAKALGNGFPIGSTIVNSRVVSAISIGDHGTTFGGNPLACRIGVHCLDRLADSKLQSHVKLMGHVLVDKLYELQEHFPDLITQVRGEGLIIGLQLTIDPSEIVKTARENGLLIITAGTNTLRFLPALVVTEEQIDEAIGILHKSIASVVATTAE